MRTSLAIALVLGLCVAAWAEADPGGTSPAASPTRAKRPLVTITGSTSGLYPGRRARLPVTFVNRSRSALVLRRITVRVRRARRGCEARELTVGRFPRSVRIRARRRVRVWLPVTLRRTAPNACQGARFPLRVRGWRPGR